MNTPGQNTPTTPIKPEKSPEQIKSQLLDMLERASPEKVVRILDTYRQLKVEHATLEYIAKHDLLTQLPNRKALDLYIKESITSIDSEAVFMIFDLRKFKDINDRYGHEIGDEVLKFIALVCREVCAIYPNSVIARKGGDEFTGIFPGCTAADTADIGKNFLRILNEKWQIRGEPLSQIHDMNIGVAMGLISVQDPGEIGVDITQKSRSKTLSEIEKMISEALFKADKMAEEGKNTPSGILDVWNPDYARQKTMSPENEHLRQKIASALRHFISDEHETESIREIREALFEQLSAKDLSYVLDELDRMVHGLVGLQSSRELSSENIETIDRQIRALQEILGSPDLK